jgi:WXG100 family type VII secretion target
VALGQYSVSFPGLDDAVTQAKQYAAQITGVLDDMDSQTHSQLSSWTGAASTEYTTTFNNLRTTAQSLPEAIAAAAGLLQSVSQQLNNAESVNAKAFAPQ